VLDETILQNFEIKFQFNEIDFKMLEPYLQSINQFFKMLQPNLNSIE
jgi:hypothetical protein